MEPNSPLELARPSTTFGNISPCSALCVYSVKLPHMIFVDKLARLSVSPLRQISEIKLFGREQPKIKSSIFALSNIPGSGMFFTPVASGQHHL
jgi:hypothetical protein